MIVNFSVAEKTSGLLIYLPVRFSVFSHFLQNFSAFVISFWIFLPLVMSFEIFLPLVISFGIFLSHFSALVISFCIFLPLVISFGIFLSHFSAFRHFLLHFSAFSHFLRNVSTFGLFLIPGQKKGDTPHPFCRTHVTVTSLFSDYLRNVPSRVNSHMMFSRVNNLHPCIWCRQWFHPFESPLHFTPCCHRQYHWRCRERHTRHSVFVVFRRRHVVCPNCHTDIVERLLGFRRSH